MRPYASEGRKPAEHHRRHALPNSDGLWVWLLARIAQLRQRRALSNLDDRLLSDIGLSREDVDRECGKPFWR